MQADKQSPAEAYPARSAWLGLAAVYGGFVSFGFVFHFLPPMLPVVIADLEIGRGAAGLLMSLFALPGILLSLPGGWLVDRYGERAVGGGGLLVMGLGTLGLGLAPNFGLILAARVLSGCGAMLAIVALQRLVVRLFAGRGLGLPLGISGSAIPLGIVVVLNTSGPLAEAAGWRTVTLRVGLAALAISLLFMAVAWFVTRGRELGRDPGTPGDEAPTGAHGFTPIWIAGLVWFAANGAMTAFVTFAPDHYLDLGFGASSRGFLTSIPMWTSAGLGVLTGWLTDRHGGRAAFMAVGMGLMALALAAVPGSVVPHALIGFVLGMSLAVVVTPTLALPGALLPESHVGRGYGILATCANTGVFALPPLAGAARDASGGYGWPFAIASLLAAGGLLAALRLARGHYMPGWSWRRLAPVAVLLLLVGGAGCGRQDRYTVVVPEREGLTVLAGGEISPGCRLPFLGLRAHAAWSRDAYVQAGPGGALVLREADLVTPLGYPDDADIAGLLCEPGGVLRVVNLQGGHRIWSAGQWLDQPDLPYPVWWLRQDDEGHPLARRRYSGELYRFEAGAWEQVVDNTWGEVEMVWAAPGAGTWAVTGQGAVLELGAAGVTCRDTLRFSRGGPEELVGDGTGRLACRSHHGEIWLYEDGVWSLHGEPSDPSHDLIYWHDGTLYGFTGSSIDRWTGEAWETGDDELGRWVFLIRSSVLDDGAVLAVSDLGETYLLEGAGIQALDGGFGRLVGVAETDDGLLIYTNSGTLLHATEPMAGAWTIVGQVDGGPSHANDQALVRDDQGEIYVFGNREMWKWDAGVLQPCDGLPDELYGMHVQSDGSFLLPTHDNVVSVRGGVISLLPTPGLSPYPVRGLWRDGSRVGVIDRYSFTWYPEGGPAQVAWYGLSWSLDRLVDLGAGEAFVLGRDNAWLIGPEGLQDLTPVQAGSEGRRHRLTAALRLASGHLVAWSASADAPLLRARGRWWQLAPNLSTPGVDLADYDPHRFQELGDGTLLAIDRNGLLRLDLSGVDP